MCVCVYACACAHACMCVYVHEPECVLCTCIKICWWDMGGGGAELFGTPKSFIHYISIRSYYLHQMCVKQFFFPNILHRACPGIHESHKTNATLIGQKGIITHAKCLRSLGLTAFRPPPGGPQAPTRVTSKMSYNIKW